MSCSSSFPWKRFGVGAALICFLALPLTAQAAGGPEKLGKFSYWTAYKLTESGHDVCYMSITAKAPESKNSKKTKRGSVVLMITHRPGENTTDVVSYAAGTKFKPTSDVNINIGSKQFNLFTQNDTAWSRDAATDHALALAIRGASTLAISGTTAQGTPIADTVALKGADTAYQAMSKACKVAISPLPHEKAAAKEKKAAKATTATTTKAAPAKKASKPKKASSESAVPSSADLKKLLSR